ncbi:Uncharacterised protein [Escherichia coli]|uniref:Uncharacterized protein n=1 Tax=Escherichia coli TaxID=562 RepID=A0A376YGF6_ECOLX|nr:Uncharacterised protein [Escherichia coli]
MIRRVIIRPATETSMFKDSSSWLSFASKLFVQLVRGMVAAKIIGKRHTLLT